MAGNTRSRRAELYNAELIKTWEHRLIIARTKRSLAQRDADAARREIEEIVRFLAALRDERAAPPLR